MRRLITILLCLTLLDVGAQTAEEKGLSIVQEADTRDTGWVDSKANQIGRAHV